MEPKLHDLTLEVTQRCPNSCLFCSSLAGPNSFHRLSLDEIVSIINQAVCLGLHTIAVSGGEPLLHPDIEQIIPALSKNLMVRFYTTGIQFGSDGKATPFADWGAFDRSSTTIIFNVQSSDPRVHDSLTRRNGSFNLTHKALLLAKQSGLRVEVHLVPNRLNLASIESSVADFIEWGVDQVSFLRLVPQGYARENARSLLLRGDEHERLSRTFTLLAAGDWVNTHLRFGVPFGGVIGQPMHCNAGESKLIIRSDGKVLPCEAFKDQQHEHFSLGDIRKNTLQEMLGYGASLTELQALKTSLPPGETCPAQLLYL